MDGWMGGVCRVRVVFWLVGSFFFFFLFNIKKPDVNKTWRARRVVRFDDGCCWMDWKQTGEQESERASWWWWWWRREMCINGINQLERKFLLHDS